MKETRWHTLKPHRVVQSLKTDASAGLSADDAEGRIATYGFNRFEQGDKETFLDRFFKQFRSPLVLILFIAGIATWVLGEHIDTIVIFVALSVNIGIGLFQESRASRAFEKLSSSQERTATVIRDGAKRVIDAVDLVPGDVVLLSAGSLIPADVYLLETRELEVNEAPLTGESIPVTKKIGTLSEGVRITGQTNMGWMGTLVASGAGRGLVVSTGDATQMGRIAESLSSTEEVVTPIQRNIRKLARFLSILVGIIVVVIFALGMIRGESFSVMILLAIAVAVSVIPEGMPAAVTAVLAIGMEKILSRGGLVRNLLAAETLGSTTVILTDKTGTLTKAEMSLFLGITAGGVSEQKNFSKDALEGIAIAVHTSAAFIEKDGAGDSVVRGNPIERAVLERAIALGLTQEKLDKDQSRKDFLPFSSDNRFAASLCEEDDSDMQMLYVAGAPSTLLEHATKMLHNGEEKPLTDDARAFFNAKLEEYAKQGVRLISVGYKETFNANIPKIEGPDDTAELLKELVLVGLLGFEDPLREDVPPAIATAQQAGARVIMMTGDNPDTARSIGMQSGIVTEGAGAQRGQALAEMDDAQLRKELGQTSIYARMLPEQKLRIVKLLQEDGEIVAMTGDGINDAPSIKRADIGVAVGSGTEVAQEASDLVLLNNSFSIIVAAIEEGRRIIDNLKKVVAHLLSTSFGEVFVVTGAIAFGLPLPILAVQILWLNIIEEGLLTFGFAFEPPEDDIMKRDPHSSRVRDVVTKDMRTLIIAAGVATGFLVLGLFLLLLQMAFSIEEIRTMIFIALSLDAIFFAIALKNFYRPIWHVKLFSNTYLLIALSVSIILLVGTTTVPPMREFLSLTPLTPTMLEILGVVALLDILIIEISKYVLFERKRSK